jgi:hypothetical protein
MIMKKGRGISLLSSAVGFLLAAGVMTLFSACGPKADGTLMNCHNAQIGAALCGICLAVLFAIAAFAKNKAVVLVCDAAALALSVVTFMIPGVLVHICLLSNMHCQVRLKPFTRGSAILIAVFALADILRIIKEKRESRS